MKRDSTIYFENKKNLSPLSKLLEEKDYKKGYEDSWMFYQNKTVDITLFNQVQKVTNPNQLEIFLETFDHCYQKNDPQNVYGELGNYLKLAKEVWYKHRETDRLEYFIVYKDSKPVAVSALTNFKRIGYISNVGSLREVRGEGFGKIATLYCVYQSKKYGNNKHCLATEEKTYANEFYKRIGFGTLFTAVGYVKKNN